MLDALTVPDRGDLPRQPGVTAGFVDPSGGASDSMVLAISHKDAAAPSVIDCIRERKAPFDPAEVTAEFATVLKAYGLKDVTGDAYAKEWPVSKFREHGITYHESARDKALSTSCASQCS